MVAKVAFVTGGNGGIGSSIVERFIKEGLTVIGCDITTDKLQVLATKVGQKSGRLMSKQCNLQREEDILKMFSEIEAEVGGVDILVNCAGIQKSEPLISGSTDAWKDMFEVNILAMCICTRETIQRLRKRGVDEGHIINISSIHAHTVCDNPFTHFYSATKHAVKAITEGLRQELRGIKSGIRVTSISPGIVKTDLPIRSGVTTDLDEHYKKNTPKPLDTQDVADVIWYAINAPQHVQVHDLIVHSHNENR